MLNPKPFADIFAPKLVIRFWLVSEEASLLYRFRPIYCPNCQFLIIEDTDNFMIILVTTSVNDDPNGTHCSHSKTIAARWEYK